VQCQADIFYDLIFEIVDRHAPMILSRVKNNDRPWVTSYFKDIVNQRDDAYERGDGPLYRKLRNKANRLRKSLCRSFIDKKIIKVSDRHSKCWWRDIKSICGIRNNRVDVLDGIQFQGKIVSRDMLPDVINSFLKSVSDGVPALSQCHSNLSSIDVGSTDVDISEFDVYRVLSNLNVSKSSLDSILNNRLLRSLADILASPICALINNSLKQGVVPSQWKVARVAPIPKCSLVRNVETGIRPISITCPVSKVAEIFVARLFDDFLTMIMMSISSVQLLVGRQR